MSRIYERQLDIIEQRPGLNRTRVDLASLVERKPLHAYIGRRQSLAVFLLLCQNLGEGHAAHVLSEMQRGAPQTLSPKAAGPGPPASRGPATDVSLPILPISLAWGALTHYVLTWADRHAWFGESFGPMGPFIIPQALANWLIDLRATSLGFKPGDVCWECACFYPYYRERRPGGDFLEHHPWLNRPCLLCGAKIAPRFHSALSFGFTKERLESAPYLVKRKHMTPIWNEQIREADAALETAKLEIAVSTAQPLDHHQHANSETSSLAPLAKAIANLKI